MYRMYHVHMYSTHCAYFDVSIYIVASPTKDDLKGGKGFTRHLVIARAKGSFRPTKQANN